MRPLLAGILLLATLSAADAGGWSTVHRYVKPTGKCGMAREVLTSYYSTGNRTASGAVFDANGNTAASWDYRLGALVTVTNPHNGRSLSILINDTGPNGIARRMGAKLDLARAAARRLGMSATSYMCVN